MAVIILPKPAIDSQCMSNDWHSPHRYRSYDIDNIQILESVVQNNTVVEIGCGVFGGIAELILKLGCKSYIGIDRSIGDPNRKAERVLRGEYIGWEKVSCVISVPDKVANHPKAIFVFGVDFLTFFRQIKNESVVTVSTGFFHDALLMPQGNGKEYIEEAICEIARATKNGSSVGLHQFMLDVNDRSRMCRSGTFFREIFEKYNIKTAPVSKYVNEQFYTLSKL